MNRMASIFLSALLLAFSFWPSSGFAFRGQSSVVQDLYPKKPDSQVQGFFDTQTTAQGTTTIDLPLLKISYGVTPHFSLETSFYSFAAWLGSTPSFSLGAKYRFYSSSQFSMAISGYGVGVWASEDPLSLVTASNMPLRNQAATEVLLFGTIFNASYHFTPRTTFTGSFAFFRLATSSAETTSGLHGAFIGPSIQHFFTSRFGLEGRVLFPLSIGVHLNHPQLSAELDLTSVAMPYALLANFKLARATFFNLGVMGTSRKGQPVAMIPTFNFTFSI